MSKPPKPRPALAVHIRRAMIDDLADLVKLENSTFVIERMSARQLRRHLESLSAEILVATRQRHVVGAVVVFFRRASDIARLYSIAVAASERGNGLGEALLAAAAHAARRRGSRRLRLEVRSDNAPAQRLYERLGYRHFGSHSGYYEDGHNALRYEKPLA
jgi:ribosomal protein S18 acetylase RimI-like enzyme